MEASSVNDSAGGGSYIEAVFTLPEPGSYIEDLLIARLGEAGYESFLQTPEGFNAYIREADFSEQELRQAVAEQSAGSVRGYEIKLIGHRNWNQEWESNFNPVVIAGKCRIRASFHEPDPSFPLEIIIDPKMSFGTGHHETTYLMAAWLLETDLAGKKVLDMGCGTCVLSILAAKLRASDVLAADIDPVCVENSLENAAVNDVKVRCRLSDIDGIQENGFDLIMANINRNVLLEHIPWYQGKLQPGGTLLVSGFYEGTDLDIIRERAEECGLKYETFQSRNGWVSARFGK